MKSNANGSNHIVGFRKPIAGGLFEPTILIYTYIITIMTLLLTAPTKAADPLDFMLVNKTGFDIYALHVSETGEANWQEDILGTDVLLDDATSIIHFYPTETARKWDLKVVRKSGTSFIWYRLDLSQISILTLYYDPITNKAQAIWD